MNKFNFSIRKWNFKKIARIYIVVFLFLGVLCTAFTGYVFRDRLSFALKYAQLSEEAEKNNPTALQNRIDSLAQSSPDITDILLLDDTNKVVYSAKQSAFKDGSLTLVKEDSYLTSPEYPGTAFRYVKKKEFMVHSFLNKDFSEVRNEYEEENFYKTTDTNTDLYLLSYIGDQDSSARIYILAEPTSVPYGITTLKIDAAVVTLLFMTYWVLLALWTYQRALKAGLYPLFWSLVVLFTNLVGVAVFAFYLHRNATCPVCGTSQNKHNIYCSNCGSKITETCRQCGTPLSPSDTYCPHCGKKHERP